MDKHLDSDCQKIYCADCVSPVKQATHGGWYITSGHPGFNSPANNRLGYRTAKMAVKFYQKYRGFK